MVKEKPNSTRVYDAEGYRLRAACICVKDDLEDEVLLVTSSRKPDSWIIPGGGVEPGEEHWFTALREVQEEAGVVGQLGRCLGVFEVHVPDKPAEQKSVENNGQKHRTKVWVLRVTEEMKEWSDVEVSGRRRKWFSIPEALILLAQHKPIQCSYLQCLLNTNPRRHMSNAPPLPHHPISQIAPIQLVNNSGSGAPVLR